MSLLSRLALLLSRLSLLAFRLGAISAGLGQLRVLLTRPRRRLGRRAAGVVHFLIELLGRRIQFRPGAPQGVGIVAQHALSRLFHTLAQLRDALARLGLGLPGLRDQTLIHKLFALIQGRAGLLLGGLANRVV